MDDLVQRCAQIQDTACTPGWPLICDVVREKLAGAQNKLAFGRCATMEDYRATVGEAQALEWVLTIPETVQGKVTELRRLAAEDREAATEDDDA